MRSLKIIQDGVYDLKYNFNVGAERCLGQTREMHAISAGNYKNAIRCDGVQC